MDENQKGNIVVGHLTLALFKTESPVPPAPGFISPFKTLQEWLFQKRYNIWFAKSVDQGIAITLPFANLLTVSSNQ